MKTPMLKTTVAFVFFFFFEDWYQTCNDLKTFITFVDVCGGRD